MEAQLNNFSLFPEPQGGIWTLVNLIAAFVIICFHTLSLFLTSIPNENKKRKK